MAKLTETEKELLTKRCRLIIEGDLLICDVQELIDKHVAMERERIKEELPEMRSGDYDKFPSDYDEGFNACLKRIQAIIGEEV